MGTRVAAKIKSCKQFVMTAGVGYCMAPRIITLCKSPHIEILLQHFGLQFANKGSNVYQVRSLSCSNLLHNLTLIIFEKNK